MKYKNEIDNCLAFQLARATTRAQDWYSQHLDKLGVTPASVYVLGLLKDSGPITPSYISTKLEITKPSVTRLLDRMHRDGWLTRNRKPDNRKVVQVRLTPAGEKVVEEAYEVLKQADEKLISQLGFPIEPLKLILVNFNHTKLK